MFFLFLTIIFFDPPRTGDVETVGKVSFLVPDSGDSWPWHSSRSRTSFGATQQTLRLRAARAVCSEAACLPWPRSPAMAKASESFVSRI